MENQLQADLAPIFRPATVQELVEFLREHPEQKLLPVGGNTKPSMSRLHGRKATQVQMASIEGVIDYQPADFTVTVAAGTKVESLNRSLGECGQFLPFDPPFASSGATVGGVVAAGLNGPCRMLWGGLRDFILAVEFVDGLGKLVRGGARVVKNSAGFDLPKFMAGSMGRYGIMTSVTLKVFPAPRSYRTWRYRANGLTRALSCLEKLSRFPLDLVAIEMDRCGTIYLRGVGSDRVLDATQVRLKDLMGQEIEAVGAESESQFWSDRRDDPLSFFSNIEGRDPDPESCGPSLIKLALSPQKLVPLDRWLEQLGIRRTYGHAGNSAWIEWPEDRSGTELNQQVIAMGMTGVVVVGNLQPGLMIASQEQAFLDRIRIALDPQERWLQ